MDLSRDDFLQLAEGGHIHLDEFVTPSSPPGAKEWMPLIDEVIALLLTCDGYWVVLMPIGEVTAPPPRVSTRADLFALDGMSPVIEPPSVNRVSANRTLPTWEGESVSCWETISPGVVSVASVNRHLNEAVDDGPWTASIVFEVSGR